MNKRVFIGCVLLVAAVPGLLFAPVFGLWQLVPPIAVVLVVCYGVMELCDRVQRLRSWRPVLALVLGALGLAEVELAATTLGGLPTAATVRALVAGATDSWQLTLQSTWPARPTADLLLFVPLIVLFTAVLGLELSRWPAVAVLPSVAALVLSQTFTALSATAAMVAVLGYAAVVAGLFVTSRPARAATALLLVPTIVLGGVAAIVVVAVDQGRQPAFTLQHNDWATAALPPTISPLAEVAARLENPTAPVFSYTSNAPVDRWRLAVLTGFDGVSWTATNEYRRLGAQVAAPPSVTVPTTAASAVVTVPAGAGPWLPSQSMPASVAGVTPLIDTTSGMLLLPGRAGPVRYDLAWQEPQIDPATLTDAAIDSTVPAGDLGVIPPGVAELARTATNGLRPSFQAALALERYLRENYQTATGGDLPTGSSWPQLRDFLLGSKRGTSEQFAAAYVVLARIMGVPARIAVGYRGSPNSGTHVVRNADVLAWPEVAVAGVGWVPLDPTGTVSSADAAASGLSQATAKARADLPPPKQLRDPPVPPTGLARPCDCGPGHDFPVWQVLGGILALIVLLVGGIPVAKAIRTARRLRRRGTGAVLAAWWEARDLLRAYGCVVTEGMTVRDLACLATEAPVTQGLLSLANQVDVALWSGFGAHEGTVAAAWAAVRDIRRDLAARPVATRVRALFDPRGLLS
ncbi:MAG TPA: transglutaminaseTgpA domain-containing protein [Pseudonocardiaceae bacterium]